MSELIDEIPTRDEFIESYNSKSSKDQAKNSLAHLDLWLDKKGITELEFFEQMNQSNSTIRARVLNEQSQFMLKNRRRGRVNLVRLSPKTVILLRNHLLRWYEENNITIPQTKIRRLAKLGPDFTELKHTPTALDINNLVKRQKNHDPATMFVLLSCTGMRINELRELRIGHIDLTNRTINIPAHHTKTHTQRITFFTPEARTWVKRHFDTRWSWDLWEKEPRMKIDKGFKRVRLTSRVSGDEFDHTEYMNLPLFDYSYNNYKWHFDQAMKDMGHTEKNHLGMKKMTIHRLRAFAKQQLASAVNDDFAEIILGHVKGNKTYNVGSSDADIKRLRTEYDKAIPLLTLGIN